MDDNERLTKAEQSAAFLPNDLREIVKLTDNLPLEELVIDAIQQLQTLHRRLKRFAGK